MNKFVIISILLILLIAGGYLFFRNNLTVTKQQDVLGNIFERPTTTKIPTPPSELGAWIAYWEEPPSLKSLALAKNEIKTISPVWYRLDSNGALIHTRFSRWSEIMNIATNSAIAVMPTINNEYDSGFDPDRVSKVLNDENKSNEFIKQLVTLALEKSYQGWDIDWEQIKVNDKDVFTKFIKSLSEALHNQQLKLSVTVHAQTGRNDWNGTKGQDIAEISKHADEVRVMAYDFHNSNSNPGPITPLNELRSVLDYSTKHIPLNKLVIGLPLYGYDWINRKGESAQYLEAVDILKRNSSIGERDQESKELMGGYSLNGVNHIIWYQDSVSVGEKISISREYGVYRFYFWRLGNEDISIWSNYKNYE